nr:protein ACCELERATED CELL DEATH 6-like [Ipomoea batatas]
MSKFMKKHPMLDYFAFNKEHQTLFDKAISCRAAAYKLITMGRRRLLNRSKTNLVARLIENPKEEEDKKLIEDKIERGKMSIIVATLIITMTFAAGITVPGGYNQEGYPILLGNAAFKAFIITNTLSFLSSICSIVVHIAMLKIASLPGCSYELVDWMYIWQDRLLRLTFLGVIIAFLCGMYATLAPKRSFAIIDLVLGISIALLPLKVYRKAYKILSY